MDHDSGPIVAINNIGESFEDFLTRGEDGTRPARLQTEMFHGDRAALWLGRRKLVVTSLPVPHKDWVRDRLGYGGTLFASPRTPSSSLSRDIMREPLLRQQVAAVAGGSAHITLIPYATTAPLREMVSHLERDHSTVVRLPESPPAGTTISGILDTKAGFRCLASEWLGTDTAFPSGDVCESVGRAAKVVGGYLDRGRACLVKPNIGEGGIGILTFHPPQSRQEIEARLKSNPLFGNDPLIVEEYVWRHPVVSPSVEMYVPPSGEGSPRVTYVSLQLFDFAFEVSGLLIARKTMGAPWYARLCEQGLKIAAAAQSAGYVGHLDVDAVVDSCQRLYLLEANTRRTSGTHLHEFALEFFGPSYPQRVVLLGLDQVRCDSTLAWERLLHLCEDITLTADSASPRGVVFTETSGLSTGYFGCAIVAPSVGEAYQIRRALVSRIPGALSHRATAAGPSARKCKWGHASNRENGSLRPTGPVP